ncbi:solute carrier family 41 member 1-like isoform X2 [Cloeon dipterum]|uniref:solute carrier family 41 member 1-like isoform X2 n=1 Tax=Cloeon dipterum TaxID=197152 RepID=UPI0032200DDB
MSQYSSDQFVIDMESSGKHFSDSSLQWGTYEFGSDMPPKGANKKGGRHRKGRKNMASLNGGGGEDEVSLMAAADLELEEDFQVQHEPKRKKSQAIPAARHKFEPEENAFSIAVQVFIPFLVAGLGMVGAGLVLDIVQHWEVFRVVSEVFILVPALLGLKGNLEMTLASRLSTQANLGYMDTPKQQWSLIVGNLSLIQCQAIVVGFLASMAAMIMGWIPEGKFDIDHGLLLCASSLVTASLASFVLGIVMIAVIIASRKFNINPDNVATPIAASMGDLITLTLLAWISSLLFEAIETQPWLAPLIIGFCLLLTPIWAWLCRQNKHTKEVLSSGWTPVVLAMLISSVGGVILDLTVALYKGIAVFQPVINGVGGNLVAVQASRISTSLHRDSKIGTLPSYASNICLSPLAVFGAKGGHARTARILLAMVIPGHLIFSYTISYLQAGHTSLTPIFVVVYLLAALIQVSLLLYMSHVMVHWMWTKRIDPDNSAIPYLTAFGDLLGTGLLAIAFQFLYVIGDRDSDVGD